MAPNLAYLVHDLNDPAVEKRALMLRAGGAEVALAGFYRRAPISEIASFAAVPLGKTDDGRFIGRAAAVARRLLRRSWLRNWANQHDVLLARNLEMLLLASRVRLARQKLVYECLDIHRMMFRGDVVGKLLRALERRLLRNCDLVITSSPAFVEEHFRKRQGYGGKIMLLENKPLTAGAPASTVGDTAGSKGPWRIGWFGMLRCAKSLEVLENLVSRANGQVEILMAGVPARSELTDFERVLERSPGINFVGPYQAQDLPRLYGQVHFSWCVDFFEEGTNSSWLLPCRLYESTANGTVPIALADVEAGRWLERQGVGVRLSDLPQDLAAFFEHLDDAQYERLRLEIRNLPRSLLVTDQEECRALVATIAQR